jgi:hypothetical protein
MGKRQINAIADGSSIKRRPSLFFRSKHKRPYGLGVHSLSLQNSSIDSAPISAISSTTSLTKPSGLRKTARKISRSVKSKIKGMFGRPKNGASAGSAQASQDADTNSFQESNLSTPEASFSQVHSHVPSLHSASSTHFLRSRQGSLESVDAEGHEVDGEKSRVTSWTSSSTHTTFGYGQDGEWEPQRLSVIDEGTNIPSPQRWTASTDNEKVYSALVQRLNDMSRQQSIEKHTSNGEQGETDGIDGPGVYCPNTNATRAACHTPDEDDVFREDAQLTNLHFGGANPGSLDEAVAKWKAETAAAVDGQSRSPETVSSPSSHLFRTKSPYGRAIQQSMEHNNERERGNLNVRYLSSLSALSLPTRNPSPDNADNDLRITSAESVYSCSSDNETILPASGGASGFGSPEAGKNQDREASYLRLDNGSDGSPLRQVHQREVSSASSVEWKTWLSAKVSKLKASTASKDFAETTG